MSDINPLKVPELVFQFLVYQSNADKNLLWYYADGSQSRRTLRIDQFVQLVRERFPDLVAQAYDSTRSTSFYLLDSTVPSITHLFPSPDENVPYLDNIQQVFRDKKAGKRTKTIVKEKTDLNDILNGYGFAPVNQQTTDNFSVKIQKNDDVRTGFLNRFFNRER